MNRILRLALVAAALAAPVVAVETTAHACGPYGAPTPEMQAENAVWAALVDVDDKSGVESLRVRLANERSGGATVVLASGKVLHYALFRGDNGWSALRFA